MRGLGQMIVACIHRSKCHTSALPSCRISSDMQPRIVLHRYMESYKAFKAFSDSQIESE